MEHEDRISSFTPSITATVSGVAADLKELLLSELTLTKLEFQRELAKAKAAAILFFVGAGLAVMGAIALVFMLVHLLATLTDVPLWGCFGIVGAALVLFSALMLASGKSKSKDVTLPHSPVAIRKDFNA
jgi:Putative Actinobacterial Holin-X, holin superfamily III